MSEQTMSDASTGKRRSILTILTWWRQIGEPMTMTVMVFMLGGIPLLVLLNLLTIQNGLRGMLALFGLAAGLLLTRLPRWLRRERSRVIVLASIGIVAIVFMVLASFSVLMLPYKVLQSALTEPCGSPSYISSDTPEMTQIGCFSSDDLNSINNATLFGQINDPEYQLAMLLAAQNGGITFKSPPRISRATFARILQRGAGNGTSPAAGVADELYDIVVSYGLDPAVALAFFAHESQLGTTGACATYNLHNWGGTRGAYNPKRISGFVKVNSLPFVRYNSWQDGLRDWCELILYRYIARGRDTIETALPIYAPVSDSNDPTAYAASVRRMIGAWQGRDYGPPPERPAPVYGPGLDTALMTETFLATGLDFHPTWAFHQYAMSEARAGRTLGAPVGESHRITVDGKQYAIQTFALDTLYTPLAQVESQTNWNDVHRMSDLLKQMLQPQPTSQPSASPPPVAPTAAPAAQPSTSPTAEPSAQPPVSPTAEPSSQQVTKPGLIP